MKHTLKAKYAADGLTSYRQRTSATRPDVLAHGRDAARRQEVVDAVTARFNEPVRPKVDNMATAFFNRAVLDSFKRQLARDYAKLDAQISAYGTRPHGDQLDAVKYAAMTSTYMTSTYMVGKRPDVLIVDDVVA